jgi:hypothetical protein
MVSSQIPKMKYHERFFKFFLKYRIFQTNFKLVIISIFIVSAINLTLAISMHASGRSLLDHKLPISESCTESPCKLSFRMTKETSDDIFLYIAFDDFYLNHRKIINSVETKQLQGNDLKVAEIGNSCDSFATIGDARRFYPNRFDNRTNDEVLNPCGLYPLLFTECIVNRQSDNLKIE